MFEKNINALEATNPELAKKIKNFPLEKAQEKIQVYDTESKEVIIGYNETPLDGVYDPIREAKTIWNKSVTNEPSSNDIQVVFGLGLGYLFKRAYVNSAGSRILLYEPFIEVLRFVFEHVDLSCEISDEKVFVSNDIKEAQEFIQQKYLSGDKLNVIYPKAYTVLANDELLNLSSAIVEICEQRNLDSNTIFKYCKDWVLHSIQNTTKYNKSLPLSFLEDKFKDKTALILSAGPSLAEDIELIKENRSKFVIICVNRALKFAIENKLTPDFAVFSDVRNILSVVEGIEDKLKDINMILDSRTNRFIVNFESKSKLLYFTKNDWIGQFLNQKNDKIKLYDSAGTVSIISYHIAKALGCSKMVFSGLDLAFKGDIAYADNKKFGTADNDPKKAVEVLDLNGNKITTRDDYALFIRQLEEILLAQKDIEVYNTTSFGAKVEGMNYKSLSELIKTLEDNDVDVDKIIKSAYEENKEEWLDLSQSVAKLVESQHDELQNLHKKVLPIILKSKEIQELLEKNEMNDIIKAQMEKHKQEVLEIIKFITKNPLLFNYLQKEILDFAKNNNGSNVIDMNAFAKMKKEELLILEEICVACMRISSFPREM